MSRGAETADSGERSFAVVSVVIPAHNEEAHIASVVRAVLDQRPERATLEVIVVDDGSTDGTAAAAERAGARVLTLRGESRAGNPAGARNKGVAASAGDPIVFLDADCLVAPGWLAAILTAHRDGATVVGGALDLPPGLPFMARCDYYSGWYLIHSRRPAGTVPHHPPPNLSVRREPFLSTGGFNDQPPLRYTNEEREWQGLLQRQGHRIHFEPKALAYHYNRPGFANLMRRNYRWGYTALESKSQSGSARLAWIYRYPRLLIAASIPLAFVHTAYILGCWLRAGVLEPVLLAPVLLVSRFAYVTGMAVGGVRWLRYRRTGASGPRPEPKWN